MSPPTVSNSAPPSGNNNYETRRTTGTRNVKHHHTIPHPISRSPPIPDISKLFASSHTDRYRNTIAAKIQQQQCRRNNNSWPQYVPKIREFNGIFAQMEIPSFRTIVESSLIRFFAIAVVSFNVVPLTPTPRILLAAKSTLTPLLPNSPTHLI